MYKHIVLFVAAICSAQCTPFDLSTHSESSSSNQLHLFMDNSTKSDSYRLSPVLNAIDNVDQAIENQLHEIMPFLNFFFGNLLGQSNDADDDCVNDMVIQLVPDSPKIPTDKEKPLTAPKPSEKPDVKSDKNINSKDVAADKADKPKNDNNTSSSPATPILPPETTADKPSTESSKAKP